MLKVQIQTKKKTGKNFLNVFVTGFHRQHKKRNPVRSLPVCLLWQQVCSTSQPTVCKTNKKKKKTTARENIFINHERTK